MEPVWHRDANSHSPVACSLLRINESSVIFLILHGPECNNHKMIGYIYDIEIMRDIRFRK